MPNRRAFAALLFATISGLSLAVACSGSDDDGATTGAGVQQTEAGSDATSDVTVTPLHDGGSFYDPDTSFPTTTGDDDDTTGSDGGTCLDQTAIEQTTYPYVKAANIMPGSCTEDELQNFIGYYEANAMFDTFSVLAWEQVVSAKCHACIFVADGPDDTVWRPIVFNSNIIDVVDVGGCVEHISGSEDCGKAFQQYEDCQNDACINTCATSEDYAACRADPLLFTTACAAATDAVNTACGQANVNVYEADCNYGTTFEGPIRVGCMELADGGLPDSGVTDAGLDAGDSGVDAGPDGGT